jgi:hypothetical protein
MVVVLLVGAWVIFDFHQKSRRFPDSRLRDLLRYLIFYNVIELVDFLRIYLYSNLTPQQSESFFSWFKVVSWPLRTLLVLGLYLFQYKTIAWLRGKKLPKWILPAISLFTAILLILFFLAMKFPEYMPRNPKLSFWNLYVWPLNLLGMIWLIRLLSENGQGSDPDRRRANRAFAWLFLARFPVLLILVFMSPEPFYESCPHILAQHLFRPLGRQPGQDHRRPRRYDVPAKEARLILPRTGNSEPDDRRQEL